MICNGKFKFKSLIKKDGGEFKNDKGETVKYNSSYSLKVDELVDNDMVERIYKIATDNALIPSLSELNPYEDITINFEVKQFSNGIKLIPISIER